MHSASPTMAGKARTTPLPHSRHCRRRSRRQPRRVTAAPPPPVAWVSTPRHRAPPLPRRPSRVYQRMVETLPPPRRVAGASAAAAARPEGRPPTRTSRLVFFVCARARAAARAPGPPDSRQAAAWPALPACSVERSAHIPLTSISPLCCLDDISPKSPD